MATEAHLGPIEAAIVALIDARIAKALGDRGTKPDVYGSRKPYPPPPGETHRTMRDKGPELVAAGFAERRGGKRGRSVFYLQTPEQHRAWQASKRTATSIERDIKPSKVVDIDSFITAAGYRATRTG